MVVPRGGWAGVLNKVLYTEAPPRGPPFTHLYTIFDREDSPFVYLPTPFTYLVKRTLRPF